MRIRIRVAMAAVALLLVLTTTPIADDASTAGSGWVWDGEGTLRVDAGRSSLLLDLDGSPSHGFHVLSSEGAHPVTWTQPERTGDGLRLAGSTADGRAARARVAQDPDGMIGLLFEVDGKREFERLAVRLSLRQRQGFVGLIERTLSGSDARSEDPGIEAGLDLWGQTVEMYTLPTLSAYVPFAASTDGYGLWLEGSWPSIWRFGVDRDGASMDDALLIESESPRMTLWVVPGPTPTEAVARFARGSGTTMLPPDWAFGPCRWRDVVWDLASFYDGTAARAPFNTMIIEDVLMMEALGIPCSMMVIDRPWGTGTFGYGTMEIDGDRLPGFSAMLSWLNGRGVRPLLFLGPWVFDGLRDELIEIGGHVPNALFYPVGSELVDFSVPEAVAWWHDRLMPFIDQGIRGFKLDRGEEKTPDGQLFRGAYGDGTSYREGHNAYPLWFATAGAEAFAEASAEEGNRAFFNIVRATWTGSSAAAAVWGGDSDPSAYGLRSAIIALQRSAAMNLPIWGSDTGGYNGRPPREVLARWLAFSAFCPLMEVGPLANLAPWAWLDDGEAGVVSANGYPAGTDYDRELLAIWHLYANLHLEMADYVRDCAARSHENGTMIVRPMMLAFPELPGARDAWAQYLYGADLLVRPVWEPGIASVDVLIPEGAWRDAWTGTVHEGPTTLRVPVPLHRIPLFARRGSGLDLGDLAARWEAAQRAVGVPPDLDALLRQEGW
jgi:alpha-glucosidase (family GH31 glycosyl hydrolase)